MIENAEQHKEQIRTKGYRETDFEKPKTFREELLERVTRMEVTLTNHTGKHKYQVVVECAILGTLIYKIFLG